MYAALLTLGCAPTDYEYRQGEMREALIEFLTSQNLNTFVEQVTIKKETPSPMNVLYQWTCKIYCYCKMPDDGNFMYQCCRCENWFHEKCLKENLEKDHDFLCEDCLKENKPSCLQNDLDEKCLKLKKMSDTYDASLEIRTLYDRIRPFFNEYNLPDAEYHIGCMTLKDYKIIVPSGYNKNNKYYGMTYGANGYENFFITLFHEELNSAKAPQKITPAVLLHEIAHALNNRLDSGGASHGPPFQKLVRALVKTWNKHRRTLPFPYCYEVLIAEEVMKARMKDFNN